MEIRLLSGEMLRTEPGPVGVPLGLEEPRAEFVSPQPRYFLDDREISPEEYERLKASAPA
jgi:hypothetical protein